MSLLCSSKSPSQPENPDGYLCEREKGHEGSHKRSLTRTPDLRALSWGDRPTEECALEQDLRKFHVRAEDGKCQDDGQAWPCNTAISWVKHGAQPEDTAEDENTSQADAEMEIRRLPTTPEDRAQNQFRYEVTVQHTPQLRQWIKEAWFEYAGKKIPRSVQSREDYIAEYVQRKFLSQGSGRQVD